MLRCPSFTLINGVTLGLALGASVLAFAVFNGYRFRPLPYVAPGQLLAARRRVEKSGMLFPLVSVKFYDTLTRLPQNFRSQHVTAASVMLSKSTTAAQFWQRARPALRRLPGTRSVALNYMVPFAEPSDGGLLHPGEIAGQRTRAWTPIVTQGLFRVMDIHFVAGSPCTATDESAGSRNVIVSAALAHALFGKTDLVGETLDSGRHGMGVAPTLPWKLDPASGHNGYAVCLLSAADGGRNVQIVLRSAADSAVLRAAFHRILAGTVPAGAIYRIRTLPQIMRQPSLNRVALTSLAIGFGAVEFLIAVLGVCAIVVCGIRPRLLEFAIRQVLGASRPKVLALTLREIGTLLIVGGAAGIAIACVAVQGLRLLLYGFAMLNPAKYLGSFALLAAAVLLVAALPVWRVMQLNPADVMSE